jgi:D-beta-D-heptose 7-phosphate kinase/D-beta-D-heptose 1-phosphate adenosyltransferase
VTVTATSAIEALKELATARVVVVGDVMLDVWVEGSARRISPEAPVPIVEVGKRSSRLGGAAHVARLVAGLGAGACLVGVTGEDEVGDELSLLLGSAAVESRLVADGTRCSTRKTRIVSAGQQICRLDEEDRHSISTDTEDLLLSYMDDAFDAADAVIISDYGKGVVTGRIIDGIVARAIERRIAVVADPSQGGAIRFSSATVVKPNRSEALAALGLTVENQESAAGLAGQLRDLLGEVAVLVTDGQHGIGVSSSTGNRQEPGIRRDVSDVTGAGDAVAAVVGLSVGAGLELDMAVRLGNAAGAVAVSKWGTASFMLSELAAVLVDRTV